MKNKFYRYSIIFVGLAVVFSCSTERNTMVSRSYHNLTARYNAYFNGKENFKEGIKKINKALTDNYTKTLPVFAYSNPSASQAASAEMEVAIKKASKVIKLHSITAKPKRYGNSKSKRKKEFYNKYEYNNWVDDAYMLLGKAQVYKKEIFLAKEAFEYVIKKFGNEPVKYEALIWNARTFSEIKNFKSAREILDRLDGENDFPEKLDKELALTWADYYLKQGLNNEAVPYLKTAIEKTRKKRVRARYIYILAQVYQLNGQQAEAADLYAEVIHLNPPYEMAFNAKINRATSFDINSGDAADIIKELNKMLRDGKNIDYQDQIYYALANIYYKQKDYELAIENYKMATQTSVSNSHIKAVSYLALADIYFGRPDYPVSQAYYDSCMTLLESDYPGYTALSSKTKNLTDLVATITTIQREDSLQKVAGMTDGDRLKVIDQIIEKVKRDEELKKQEEQQQMANSMQYKINQSMKNTNMNNTGKWYFYNTTTLGIGMAEFRKKWGTRKLEDNWRRKNKSVVVVIAEDENTEEGDTAGVAKIADNKSREYYLQDLPMNDSLIAVSHGRIEDALYDQGIIYQERIIDFPRSVLAFEELIKRYPATEYLLTSYYHLYQLNQKMNKQDRADYYKGLIVSEFPDSKYAKVLTNPNYIRELEEQNNQVTRLYMETYDEYVNRNFTKVIENANLADSVYKTSPLLPKFAFLRAFANGAKGDILGYKKVLGDIVTRYPKTAEQERASDIIALLDKGDYSFVGLNTNNTTTNNTTNNVVTNEQNETGMYIPDDQSVHYYVILIENKTLDINRLKFNLVNYNIDNFSMFDFAVKISTLSPEIQMITVKSLADKKDALKYYKSLNKYADLFKDMISSDYKQFIISADNFTKLYDTKNVARYLEFYNKNYLGVQ